MDATRNGPEYKDRPRLMDRVVGDGQTPQIRKVIQLKPGGICANLQTCKVFDPKFRKYNNGSVKLVEVF